MMMQEVHWKVHLQQDRWHDWWIVKGSFSARKWLVGKMSEVERGEVDVTSTITIYYDYYYF